MKKVWIFVLVYGLFLVVPIEAKSDGVEYRIYADSRYNEARSIKEELFELFDELLYGVDKSSYISIIVDSISYLENELDCDILYKNGKLIVESGNAKGTMLKGKYQKKDICIPKVEAKSKLQEWFDF